MLSCLIGYRQKLWTVILIATVSLIAGCQASQPVSVNGPCVTELRDGIVCLYAREDLLPEEWARRVTRSFGGGNYHYEKTDEPRPGCWIRHYDRGEYRRYGLIGRVGRHGRWFVLEHYLKGHGKALEMTMVPNPKTSGSSIFILTADGFEHKGEIAMFHETYGKWRPYVEFDIGKINTRCFFPPI